MREVLTVAAVVLEGLPGLVATSSASRWDRTKPLFRYVEYPGDVEYPGALSSGSSFAAPPRVVDETLICLDHAHPLEGFAAPRVLSEQAAAGVFAAWEIARADVVEKWNFLADKANLEPKLPPELDRAAEVLRSHAPPGLTQKELDDALDTICAPHPERTIRTFRVARKSRDDPGEQAEAILGVVKELGLQPYAAPEPLPEITEDDVYLVCWLALS